MMDRIRQTLLLLVMVSLCSVAHQTAIRSSWRNFLAGRPNDQTTPTRPVETLIQSYSQSPWYQELRDNLPLLRVVRDTTGKIFPQDKDHDSKTTSTHRQDTSNQKGDNHTQTFTCPHYKTCQNRCGQVTGVSDTIMFFPCQCDRICLLYGDCCPDYYHSCLQTDITQTSANLLNTTISHIQTYSELIHLHSIFHWSQVSTCQLVEIVGFVYKHIQMVTQCSTHPDIHARFNAVHRKLTKTSADGASYFTGLSQDDIRQRCQQAALGSRQNVNDYPVHDTHMFLTTDESVHFYNLFCAVCNGVRPSDLTSWFAEIQCNGTAFTSVNEISQAISNYSCATHCVLLQDQFARVCFYETTYKLFSATKTDNDTISQPPVAGAVSNSTKDADQNTVPGGHSSLISKKLSNGINIEDKSAEGEDFYHDDTATTTTTSVPWDNSTYAMVNHLCGRYQYVYSSSTIMYKNPHCHLGMIQEPRGARQWINAFQKVDDVFLCPGKSCQCLPPAELHGDYYVQTIQQTPIRGAMPLTPSFRLLFDFRSNTVYTETVSNTILHLQTKTCPRGQVYLPSLMTCTQVQCAEGMQLTGHSCVPTETYPCDPRYQNDSCRDELTPTHDHSTLPFPQGSLSVRLNMAFAYVFDDNWTKDFLLDQQNGDSLSVFGADRGDNSENVSSYCDDHLISGKRETEDGYRTNTDSAHSVHDTTASTADFVDKSPRGSPQTSCKSEHDKLSFPMTIQSFTELWLAQTRHRDTNMEPDMAETVMTTVWEFLLGQIRTKLKNPVGISEFRVCRHSDDNECHLESVNMWINYQEQSPAAAMDTGPWTVEILNTTWTTQRSRDAYNTTPEQPQNPNTVHDFRSRKSTTPLTPSTTTDDSLANDNHKPQQKPNQPGSRHPRDANLSGQNVPKHENPCLTTRNNPSDQKGRKQNSSDLCLSIVLHFDTNEDTEHFMTMIKSAVSDVTKTAHEYNFVLSQLTLTNRNLPRKGKHTDQVRDKTWNDQTGKEDKGTLSDSVCQPGFRIYYQLADIYENENGTYISLFNKTQFPLRHFEYEMDVNINRLIWEGEVKQATLGWCVVDLSQLQCQSSQVVAISASNFVVYNDTLILTTLANNFTDFINERSSDPRGNQELENLTDAFAREFHEGNMVMYEKGAFIKYADTVIVCNTFNGSYRTKNVTVISTEVSYRFVPGSNMEKLATLISSILSIICLTITLVVYGSLSSLQNLPGKIVISLSLALLLAQVLFLCSLYPQGILCQIYAAVHHAAWLASFAWLAIMSVDLAYILRFQTSGHMDVSGGHRFGIFSAVGWGLPLLIALICFVLDTTDLVSISYGMSGVCWIGNWISLVIFFGVPVFTFLAISSVSAIFVVHAIKTSADFRRTSTSTCKKDRQQLILCINLSLLMGLNWIFYFLAVGVDVDYLWMVHILVNGSQGVYIFLCYVARKSLWSKMVIQWCPGWDRATDSAGSPKTSAKTATTTTTRLGVPHTPTKSP